MAQRTVTVAFRGRRSNVVGKIKPHRDRIPLGRHFKKEDVLKVLYESGWADIEYDSIKVIGTKPAILNQQRREKALPEYKQLINKVKSLKKN